MKWLCREMNEDEIYNLRLEDRQMIYYISQWPWRRWQRQALYRNIRRTFNLNVNTMSIQDFKALGEFFCGMDSSDIASIPPELYYSMATFVGELVTCDYNQMRSLLAKARSTQAFGEIEHWEERHVIAIGSAICKSTIGLLNCLVHNQLCIFSGESTKIELNKKVTNCPVFTKKSFSSNLYEPLTKKVN